MSTPPATFDVCLGASNADAHAQVLVTVTDAIHADALVLALSEAQSDGALFQCEGLTPFSRAVDRMTHGEPVDFGRPMPELPALGDGPVELAAGLSTHDDPA